MLLYSLFSFFKPKILSIKGFSGTPLYRRVP
uniref:Uncharacterized protein n=1 Tax=CrAss-like virus sp. ctYsL76 TaxID=2826826 RepID=A0A8S5QL84_9CAUD|nr:MAG TPA: hypothetical protein [CrAss-like virus sp. ctYsL76]